MWNLENKVFVGRFPFLALEMEAGDQAVILRPTPQIQSRSGWGKAATHFELVMNGKCKWVALSLTKRTAIGTKVAFYNLLGTQLQYPIQSNNFVGANDIP